MSDLKVGIRDFQKKHGERWWPEFVRFYWGSKRTCDWAESCALQSLASEVARSDTSLRTVFASELREVATMILSGPAAVGAPQDLAGAYAALATLVGAVTLARAVSDAEVAGQIAAAAEHALLRPLAAKGSSHSRRRVPAP